ncbi:retrotransposon protein, putative, ty1-copia subclass [Tanacetum coccineum]
MKCKQLLSVSKGSCKTNYGKDIKSLIDRGGEYMSQEFLDHLKERRIIAHRTPLYKSQHNGVSERRNRTLLDMVHSMMSQTTLPKSFWDYAFASAALWGCKAIVKHDTLTKPDKLEPRSIKCIFIGYPKETIGYSFYYPPENKVLVARNAEFFENSLITQEVSGSLEDLKIIQEDLVDLPPNGKTVGSKWLFKKKTDMDGAVHTYKACLVAKGFTQTYRIWQMDVKIAFLNEQLSEGVYMVQPKGFVNPKFPNRVCKLKRSINGLKQASWQWNKRFDDEIKKFSFTQNRDEPCDVKYYLGRCFALKDLGEAAYILRIKIYRDRSKQLIGLCQSAYIEKILKRYFMENSKRGTIPMQEKQKLSKSQGASTPAEKQHMRNVPYASNLGELHWTTVKNILKYLRNTKDTFLVYGGDMKRVSCYTDVGYVTDTDDLKSQTGYVFVLNGGAIDWKSTKQSIFATSSTEAEYIAAYDVSKEAV